MFNQRGEISTLKGGPLKLVDKFTYFGSSVSSTEKVINKQLVNSWTAIDKLLVIWKSDLTDKTKRSFFQAAVVSVLLYGCTTWTLAKRMVKKLDGNYIRMLWAVLKNPGGNTPQNISSTATYYPSRKQSTLDEPDMRDNQDLFISNVLLWNLSHRLAKAEDQQEPFYNISAPIQDVAWRTCLERWTIETSDERVSW